MKVPAALNSASARAEDDPVLVQRIAARVIRQLSDQAPVRTAWWGAAGTLWTQFVDEAQRSSCAEGQTSVLRPLVVRAIVRELQDNGPADQGTATDLIFALLLKRAKEWQDGRFEAPLHTDRSDLNHDEEDFWSQPGAPG